MSSVEENLLAKLQEAQDIDEATENAHKLADQLELDRAGADNVLGPLMEHVLKERSILVVDDEPEIRKLIGRYLDRTQFDDRKVVFACDGAEAALKIKNQEFGLVIIDIAMPKKNGLKLVQELKAKMRTRKMPVLLISGNLHAEVVKQAIFMGIKDILAKPFNYNVFIERLFKTISPNTTAEE